MSETAAILARTVDDLLTDHVDRKLLESCEQGIWAKDLWALIEAQGLTLALVPEDRGGIGASFQDAFVIVRACGRHRAPVPLPETMAAAWLLTSVGLETPSGSLSLAATQAGDQLRLDRVGSGWLLSGTVRRVPWGRNAHAVALAVADGDETMIVRATGVGASGEPGVNFAGEPRDALVFREHPVDVAPWPHDRWRNPVNVIGAMMRTGQMAGALSEVLERSVTYANDRRQFGRAISKQQAVQQNLSVLAAETAAVGVAAETAFLAADRGDPAFLTAVAKVRAGSAVPQAARIAHQVHGAIGFTLEFPLHLSTRRLLSWRTEFGSDRHWAVSLGRQVLGHEADGFGPLVTAH
jgi:acyl-CoA dehydrogenase